MLQRLRHYIVDICSLIFVNLCLFVIFVIYVRYICSLILVMCNSNTAVPIQGHYILPYLSEPIEAASAILLETLPVIGPCIPMG